ncbi:hypothetical protein K6L09_45755, partial [Burkholderia cepacia]
YADLGRAAADPLSRAGIGPPSLTPRHRARQRLLVAATPLASARHREAPRRSPSPGIRSRLPVDSAIADDRHPDDSLAA